MSYVTIPDEHDPLTARYAGGRGLKAAALAVGGLIVAGCALVALHVTSSTADYAHIGSKSKASISTFSDIALDDPDGYDSLPPLLGTFSKSCEAKVEKTQKAYVEELAKEIFKRGSCGATGQDAWEDYEIRTSAESFFEKQMKKADDARNCYLHGDDASSSNLGETLKRVHARVLGETFKRVHERVCTHLPVKELPPAPPATDADAAAPTLSPDALFNRAITDFQVMWNHELQPQVVQVRSADLKDVPSIQPYYMFIPELDKDRFETLARSWRVGIPDKGPVMIEGVWPGGWPTGGRYEQVKGAFLRHFRPEPKDFQNALGLPWWWKGRDLRGEDELVQAEGAMGAGEMMRAIRPNGASSLEFGLQHHQGCALSHVLAWMTALDRHEGYVLYAESDAAPGSRGGMEILPEFQAALKAAIKYVPNERDAEWDLIYLDKGDRGTQGGPLTTLRNGEWVDDYHLLKWVGNGQAGSGFYLTSPAFHKKIVRVLRAYGLVMVDAWIGGQCSRGAFRCYSMFGVPKRARLARAANRTGAEPRLDSAGAETKAEMKAETKAETKAEMKAETKAETKAEKKAEMKAETKAATKSFFKSLSFH